MSSDLPQFPIGFATETTYPRANPAEQAAVRGMNRGRAAFSGMGGMTLIEMSVILLIMLALATVLVPHFTNAGGLAQCVATDTSMAGIRDAIMGSGGQPGYWSDMGKMPDSALNHLFTNPSNNSVGRTFNPTTQRGWRGPYLNGGASCGGLASMLDSFPGQSWNNNPSLSGFWSACGFPESASSPIPPNTGRWNQSLALDSFNPIGLSGQNSPVIRSPIRLYNDQGHYFLASGGNNNSIDSGVCSYPTVPLTSPAPLPTCTQDNGTYWICPVTREICEIKSGTWVWSLATRNNDDRILFLDAVDPGNNKPCSD